MPRTKTLIRALLIANPKISNCKLSIGHAGSLHVISKLTKCPQSNKGASVYLQRDAQIAESCTIRRSTVEVITVRRKMGKVTRGHWPVCSLGMCCLAESHPCFFTIVPFFLFPAFLFRSLPPVSFLQRHRYACMMRRPYYLGRLSQETCGADKRTRDGVIISVHLQATNSCSLQSSVPKTSALLDRVMLSPVLIFLAGTVRG